MKNSYVKIVMGITLLLTVFAFSGNAQIHSTTGGGPWDSTWAWVGGIVPTATYDVIINGPVYSSNNACNNLIISAGGSLQNNFYGYTLTVYGNLANSGIIRNYQGSGYMFYLRIHGNIANNGTWTNHYTYLNGSTNQHFTSLNDSVFSGYQLINENTSGVIYFDNEARFENTELRFNNHPAEISANSTLYLHDGFLYQTTLTGNGSTSILYGLGVSNVDAPYIDVVTAENLSIDGAVNVKAVTFNETVINNGILQNDFYQYTLTINDDFINNGTIENYVGSGYILYTNIYGNITNNGTWQNQYMQFYGDANQEITLQAGKNFSPYAFTSYKSDGHFEALTNLEFDQVNIDFVNDTLFLQNNSSISLSGGSLYRGIVLANDAKSGTFELNLINEAYIQDCNFTNSILTGNLDCRNNTFYGHTVNNGIIQNDYSTYQVTFYDLFTNNGTIKNFTGSGYILYVDVYGDIINNGIWNNHDIEMQGDALQTYTQINDSKISTTYFTIINTNSYLEALSDILFENCNVNLNGDTLLLPSGGLISHDGGYLYNGTVLANDAKSGDFDLFMVNEAYIQDCDLFNPTILGKVDCRNNTFHGDIIVEDTLQNDYSNYTLNIDGNIINNGVIQYYEGSGYTFYVYISGNLTNNGSWSNQYTYLNGSADQHFACLNGNVFSGYQLTNENTGSVVYFDNESRFENTRLWFNNHPAEIPTNSTLYLHDGFLYQTTLTGNGPTSILQGLGVSNVDAPYLDAVTADNLTIEGAVNVKTVTFNGTVINNGILQNDFYNYTLTINDDFINNGTIENYSGSGYNLTNKVYGNITNNGVWDNIAIDFYGDNNQQLSLQTGNTFSPAWMTSFKTNGHIEALTDLVFDHVNINLDFDTLFLQNNSSLTLSSGYLYQGVILANDAKSGNLDLFMDNEAYIHDCHIYNPALYGRVNCKTNTFHGDIIVEDTLQNDFYGYTLTIDGNITNNGIIQNYVGSGYGFTINISGDLTNNGQWTNSVTHMNGITDQYIHLQDGYDITGQMRFVSDVLVSPYQWYWNGWAIENPPWPDPPIFNGYTSSTLVFLNPVADNRLGTYYCNTGGGQSRNIIVDETSGSAGLSLDITAFFEGPFNGTNMNDDLNGILPLEQPYNTYPWEYNGGETVASIPNSDIVDWLLVELRDASDVNSATSATSLGGQAAFILRDGSIVDLDGSSILTFDFTITQNLFIVLWHRNHLPVVSEYPLAESSGIYTYNFTSTADQAYGDNQSDLGGGKFGMIAGDANADGTINDFDGIEAWYPQVGNQGYYSADVNMDTQVDNPDKNDIWLPNYGKTEQLPGSGSSCGSTLIDSRDGQSYNTIQIGTQCWMAENLNIGTRINGTSSSSNNGVIEKYCYNDLEANCTSDGGFYIWDEMMEYSSIAGSQGVCPDGWHIPSHTEWCTMEQYLDPTVVCDDVAWRGTDIGTQLKIGGTSGFNAILTGGRYWDGSFQYDNVYAYYWTSSSSGTAVSRHIVNSQTGVYRANNTKTFGLSARCVKD